MKVAVIGSRSITRCELSSVIPPSATEIVSGGARGVDALAREYAHAHHLKYTEFLPDYPRYHRGAPLRRNLDIVCYSDMVIAVWDGRSPGTRYVIETCRRLGKPVIVLP